MLSKAVEWLFVLWIRVTDEYFCQNAPSDFFPAAVFQTLGDGREGGGGEFWLSLWQGKQRKHHMTFIIKPPLKKHIASVSVHVSMCGSAPLIAAYSPYPVCFVTRFPSTKQSTDKICSCFRTTQQIDECCLIATLVCTVFGSWYLCVCVCVCLSVSADLSRHKLPHWLTGSIYTLQVQQMGITSMLKFKALLLKLAYMRSAKNNKYREPLTRYSEVMKGWLTEGLNWPGNTTYLHSISGNTSLYYLMTKWDAALLLQCQCSTNKWLCMHLLLYLIISAWHLINSLVLHC